MPPTDRKVLPFLAVGALLLHAWAMGSRALWYDEVTTYAFASKSLADLWTFLNTHDVHPPLFFALEKFALALPLPAEWSLRLLPLGAALTCIPLAEAFARRVYRVRWHGAVLAAVFPGLVMYGQEARAYAPLLMFEFTALLALVHVREQPEKRRWIALSVAALWCAAAMSYLAILFLPVISVALLLWTRRRGYAVAALAAAFLLYFPWLPRAWETFFSTAAGVAGNPPRALGPGSYARLFAMLWGGPVPAVLAAVLSAAAFWRVRREPVAGLILVLAVVPLALFTAAPPRYPFFPARYLITWSGLPLLLLPALGRLRPLAARAAPVALAIVLLVPAVRFHAEQRTWNRDLAAMAAERFGDGDILIVHPYYQSIALAYYLPLDPAIRARILENPLINYDGAAVLLNGRKQMGLTSPGAFAELAAGMGIRGNVYVLVYGPPQPPIDRWLVHLAPVQHWEQASLYRLVTRPRVDPRSQQLLLGTLPVGRWVPAAARPLNAH